MHKLILLQYKGESYPQKNYEFFFECLSELKNKFNYDKFKVLMAGNSMNKNNSVLVKLIEKKTLQNRKITLSLALNYGSKEEIVNACKKLALKKNKKISVNDLEKELYTHNIPDPEILIRTGGTKRLSNFLLWQLAYTEIFFIDKLWPDFNKNDFNKIIIKFNKIKRNFGEI